MFSPTANLPLSLSLPFYDIKTYHPDCANDSDNESDEVLAEENEGTGNDLQRAYAKTVSE